MRQGFVTFEGMDYTTACKKAEEFGFNFIEFQMAYVSGRNKLGREFMASNEEDIRFHLTENDLVLAVHLPHSIDIGSPSPGIRKAGVQEIKECIQTIARLDAEKAVIHPTAHVRQRVWDDEVIRTYVLESINELHSFGDEHGVELCMENIPGSVFSIGAFDKFFVETDCSMTLDTGHARISGWGPNEMTDFIGEHSSRISHIHINDNKQFIVGPDNRPTDDHVPTGSGDLEFIPILRSLNAEEWDGTLSIEVQTQNYDYVKYSKNQLEQWIEHV